MYEELTACFYPWLLVPRIHSLHTAAHMGMMGHTNPVMNVLGETSHSVCRVFVILSVYPVSVCLCFQTFQLMFFGLFSPWMMDLSSYLWDAIESLILLIILLMLSMIILWLFTSQINNLIVIRLINFTVFLYLWIWVLSKLFSSFLDMWVFVEGIIWRSFCTFDSTFSYCIDRSIFETVSRFPDTHYYLIK